MKRFLKHDRYELGDRDRETIWHGIRRELKSEGRTSVFRTVSLRPALGAVVTVAALAVLGVWWIDSDQADKVRIEHPDLLAEGPRAPEAFEAPEARSRDLDEPLDRLVEARPSEKKAPEPASAEEIEVAASRTASKGPRAAPGKDLAITETATAAKATAEGSLTGRIIDNETGQGLAYASIVVRGTTRSALADSNGFFHLGGLSPGRDITLVVMMAGYDPLEQVVTVPAEGPIEYAFNLEPVAGDKLQAFDVAGAEYMVETRSGVSSRNKVDKEEADSSGPVAAQTLGEQTGVRNDRRQTSPQEAPPPAGKGAGDWRYGGSVTGGTNPPNDEQVELMYFEHTGVNPFVATEDDSLSTFAVDVDNASWTVARNYLTRGMLPPKDSVRVEEFVNAFDPGWERHSDDVFRIHTDGAISRFGEGYHLLRVGVVGRTVEDENRKAANLIFVIDISGSMNRENRLGAVKESLRILLNELGEGDRVGLVVYGSRGEVRLEPTDISRREVIMQAIDGLISNGSTNVYEGLDLAYDLARKHYEPAKVNRLILCSDGVANNGASTEAEKILSLVRKASDDGITISTIGFGMGNYNDVMMEKLADKGDGNYYYVDRQEEAERVFRENLTGLLQTIAREVKVQVEFDTSVVTRWRLIGYENRDVADRDFRNDAVDAGEVGAGHQVTALYEVKLARSVGEAADQDNLRAGIVRLRHEAPTHDTVRAGQVEEIEQAISLGSLTGTFGDGTVWMRVQSVAAEFAEILRGSYWAKESRLADLVPVADGLAAAMPGDPLVRDLADMIRQAADIQDASGEDEDN